MLFRYRFKTNAVADYRPLYDLKKIQMPWWCTGRAADDSYVTIVCYLPDSENLFRYWDDAYDIETTEAEEIVYTKRLPKPNWIKQSGMLVSKKEK